MKLIFKNIFEKNFKMTSGLFFPAQLWVKKVCMRCEDLL